MIKRRWKSNQDNTIHRPTLHRNSSCLTQDESETRGSNEWEDLPTEKRREKQSRGNTCIVQPSIRNHRPVPTRDESETKRNNARVLRPDDKERRRTVETLPIEEAHRLNPVSGQGPRKPVRDIRKR